MKKYNGRGRPCTLGTEKKDEFSFVHELQCWFFHSPDTEGHYYRRRERLGRQQMPFCVLLGVFCLLT
jgi:hypothetical protein